MIIQDAIVFYEHIKVKINGEWFFLDPHDLKGIKIEGDIETKRTRTWFKPKEK